MRAQWHGRAWLWPGFGVFAGMPGDNQRHAHLAHQVTIARRGGVAVVECASGRIESAGIVVPAGQAHRLLAAEEVVSIYVEPLALGAGPRVPFAEACEPLDGGECARLLGAVAQLPDPQPLIGAILGEANGRSARGHDARWLRVSTALLEAPSDPPQRHRLAALACLSPSRFSHWFVEQAGLPLRAYRKWLRLQGALGEVAAGHNLTRAAHTAGFADAAHLSRTFRAMFGIDPSTALSALDWRAIAPTSLSLSEAGFQGGTSR